MQDGPGAAYLCPTIRIFEGRDGRAAVFAADFRHVKMTLACFYQNDSDATCPAFGSGCRPLGNNGGWVRVLPEGTRTIVLLSLVENMDSVVRRANAEVTVDEQVSAEGLVVDVVADVLRNLVKVEFVEGRKFNRKRGG